MTTPRFLLATLLLATPAWGQQAQRQVYRPGIDVLDYEISLDLPQMGNVIEGRTVLTVRRTARTDTLILDLLSLTVDSVLVNQRAVAFGRDSATIRVPLPAGSGDTLKVAVRYGGAVTDGLIVHTDSLGRWTGFGDNFPNRARYWIPSVDHPSDKATVSWIIRAPSDRKVVANGVRLEETPIAGSSPPRTLTHWREAQPVTTYVMVIAAAPLYEYSIGETACGQGAVTRCVPQYVYLEPELKAFLPGPFARVGEIVSFYASLVGPFPYEKLAHLQSSTRYGGMENSSQIFYSDAGFRRGQLGEGTVAHETAHQWFGDGVTETEWPHMWLSEGFATYFAALWTQKSAGDSAFRASMERIRRTITTNAVVAARPVIDTIETDINRLLNRNSYEKGGFVLHMLRSMMGDSAFFRGLRTYQAKYRNGNALSDDLRRELEASSHLQLGWFFDQWLRKPGFPELTASWSYDAANKRLNIEVAQGARFGTYRFPLEIQTRTAAGRTAQVRVDVAAQANSTLTVPLTEAPAGVVFDPDVKLLATFMTK